MGSSSSISIPLEFTPKAYAFEVAYGTTFEQVEAWLESRGLPCNGLGMLRLLGTGQFQVVASHGGMDVDEGDWLVVFMGELHVMSRGKWQFVSTGIATKN